MIWQIFHVGAEVYAIMAFLGIVIMAWAYFRAPVQPELEPSYEDTLFDNATEWRNDFETDGDPGPEIVIGQYALNPDGSWSYRRDLHRSSEWHFDTGGPSTSP